MAENDGIGQRNSFGGAREIDRQLDPRSSRVQSPPKVSLNVGNDSEDVCKICWAPGDLESPLYYACACRGSIKYVHEKCLLQWLNYSESGQCQICKIEFTVSMAHDKSTLSMLSFRELLREVVSKKHLLKSLLLKGLLYFGVVWATKTPFTDLVTTPVKPTWKELLFFVMVMVNVYEKLALLETIISQLRPQLRIVGGSRAITFMFTRWVFPSFGYSIIINSFLNQISCLVCLGLEVDCWCVVRGLFDLYRGIRNNQYLVRRRLHNYGEREKAQVD